MRKCIFLAVLILFSLFISINVTALTYKQNTNINITLSCSELNCSTDYNVSIISPSSQLLVDNQQTLNKITHISYEFQNTSSLGEYQAYFKGEDNSSASLPFEITTTGEPRLKEGEGTIIFTLIFSMILIGIFFTVIAFTFKENWAGKLIFFSLASLCFIAVIMYGLVISESTLGIFNNLSGGYSTFWTMIKTLIGIFILALLIFSFFIVFKIHKKRRGLED